MLHRKAFTFTDPQVQNRRDSGNVRFGLGAKEARKKRTEHGEFREGARRAGGHAVS